MLHQFYAVTQTSLYFVKDRRNKKDPCPFARKIMLNGESKSPVGSELENGTMIAITTQLQAYVPEGGGMTSYHKQIEGVNTRWWGGHSSGIVALFTKKSKALECFNSRDLVQCDSRWIEETKNVINKIGEDHPSFYVCEWGDLSLLNPVQV